MWDNAYTIHHFNGRRPKRLNILQECQKNGNESRPFIFASFSKISIGGGGVTCVATAGKNRDMILRRINAQTIGPDKINQLRHARYFKNLKGIENHMKLHAEILRPKFEQVINYFSENLKGRDSTFTMPKGGYFISVEVPGSAKRVRELCKDMGVLLTEAGSTFPYYNDPADSNLRFAPTFLSMEELGQALEVFCLAVQIAAEEEV
jgi:DNA-binding transcriptional MocR family regulator